MEVESVLSTKELEYLVNPDSFEMGKKDRRKFELKLQAKYKKLKKQVKTLENLDKKNILTKKDKDYVSDPSVKYTETFIDPNEPAPEFDIGQKIRNLDKADV